MVDKPYYPVIAVECLRMDFHIPSISAAPDLIAANLCAAIGGQACKRGQCREGVDMTLCIALQHACDGAPVQTH